MKLSSSLRAAAASSLALGLAVTASAVTAGAATRTRDFQPQQENHALFVESNPIPVKAALASLKLCTNEVRLPLTRATPATEAKLHSVLAPVMREEEQATRRPVLAMAS